MNISESNAVCRIIDALGRPESAALTSGMILDDLQLLARKANKVLAAGPRPDDVEAAWKRNAAHQPQVQLQAIRAAVGPNPDINLVQALDDIADDFDPNGVIHNDNLFDLRDHLCQIVHSFEATVAERIPITRHDVDGTVTDGTARVSADGTSVGDFRDLDGQELILPPGSSFRIPIYLPNREGS